MYFIGYDIGSSSIKATLLDGHNNREVCSSQYPKTEMSMIAHHPGWAEQKPETWWSHVQEATKDILSLSQVNKEDIKAIGISYQMHGLVVVDEDLKALRPSIIWCDSRAVPYGDKAQSILGESYCQDHVLNSPGNFTAAKLGWIKAQEPELYSKIHAFMLPGDYIALRLSGEATTTYSGLSEGVLYDFKSNDVSKPVLEALGLDSSLVPKIVPTFGRQVAVSAQAAAELGLAEGTPITYRAGDQPNNALSLNVLKPGELAATAGTSGVIYGVNDTLASDKLSRVNAFAHVNHTAEQKRIGILLCINGTGILNAWLKKITNGSSYVEMNQAAERVPIGAEGLMIFPFGNGAERILQNKEIGSSIHGLSFNTHGQGHLYRAGQEGIACSLAYGAEVMGTLGLTSKVIRAGEANLFLSDLFQEAVANLTGATIELYNTDGAQGAARGAGIGLGHYTFDDAFDGLHLRKRIEPTPEKSAQYKELYGRWKEALTNTLQ